MFFISLHGTPFSLHFLTPVKLCRRRLSKLITKIIVSHVLRGMKHLT